MDTCTQCGAPLSLGLSEDGETCLCNDCASETIVEDEQAPYTPKSESARGRVWIDPMLGAD